VLRCSLHCTPDSGNELCGNGFPANGPAAASLRLHREPCRPSRVARPPSGPIWVHEIKHDGYRLMVRRDGARVRCFTRNGHDWADRFPAIVDAALRIKATSFLIDGEAVIAHDDGMSDSRALRKAARARLTRPLTARA
jgi:ATP-dependent DNA ligase